MSVVKWTYNASWNKFMETGDFFLDKAIFYVQSVLKTVSCWPTVELCKQCWVYLFCLSLTNKCPKNHDWVVKELFLAGGGWQSRWSQISEPLTQCGHSRWPGNVQLCMCSGKYIGEGVKGEIALSNQNKQIF